MHGVERQLVEKDVLKLHSSSNYTTTAGQKTPGSEGTSIKLRALAECCSNPKQVMQLYRSSDNINMSQDTYMWSSLDLYEIRAPYVWPTDSTSPRQALKLVTTCRFAASPSPSGVS
jgi:hypothetical protein